MRLNGLTRILFGRRSRTAEDQRREQIWTVATTLTLFRAIVTSAIFVSAIAMHWYPGVLIGLSVSMSVDFLDGIAARSRSTETILGAQLDGLADRLAVIFVLAGVVLMRGQAPTIVVAACVWLQFGVVDQFLSSQFLRFDLWSPDHFYAIDEQVWRWNWSPQAKLASNTPIILLAVGSWCVWPAALLSIALVALRLPIYMRIRKQAEERIGEQGLAKATARVEREPRPTRQPSHKPAGPVHAPVVR